MKLPDPAAATCPVPLERYPLVTLAHGGGGKLMNRLIGDMFVNAFANEPLSAAGDAAILPASPGRLAVSTDSFVVRPLFFPGGDIGCLAVYGTVNDVAMVGARPKSLTLGLILEEGFPMEELWKVVQSIRHASNRVGVPIVTGDTKVVENGKGDGVYINTTGIGVIEHDRVIGPGEVEPGDAIVVSGDLGRHGVAVMALREGLEFESTIKSDCAPLVEPVHALIDAGFDIHCMRDLTRGGLGAAVHEIAASSRHAVELDEKAIPVAPEVRGACELLGLDPIHVANEGRFLIALPADQAMAATELLGKFEDCPGAGVVGVVADRNGPPVTMRSILGTSRIVDFPSGEQLPRIC